LDVPQDSVGASEQLKVDALVNRLKGLRVQHKVAQTLTELTEVDSDKMAEEKIEALVRGK
jgi:hypothetical protein